MGETPQENSHIPARLNILFLLVFLFFAAIILRLAYVQLVEGEKYKHDLEMYSTKEIPIPAPRGKILDRNGEVLVSNKPVYTVTFVEKQGENINKEDVANKLAALLKMDDEDELPEDKELLKKAVELNANLPVSFGEEKTQKLVETLRPILAKLPSSDQVEQMSDQQLLKTGLQAGMYIRSPFTESQRNTLLQRYLKEKKWGEERAADVTDRELLLYYIGLPKAPFALEKETRSELEESVAEQLQSLPSPNELAEKTDQELLRLTSLFDLDVALPLTQEEKRFQWRKLKILKEMISYNLPSYLPRRIKVNITTEEMHNIEERLTELPGISVTPEPIRQIRKDADGSPFGTHFLGYTNSILPEQLEEYLAQGYSQTDRVGVAGLERYYERQLRGKDGIMEVRVNKDSQTVEKRQKRAPEPGNDLVLALDYRYQSKVEEILKTQIEEMKKNPKTKDVKEALALALNPHTGEIYAMALYPDYDLNLHYDREKFNELYATQIRNREENKIIRGGFPPGSTVKAVSVMIALQEGLTTEREFIYDPGYYRIGNTIKYNWKRSGHGRVDARRALQVSNNTFMYTMADRLGRRAKKSYVEQFSLIDFYNSQFGLGIKTGIDLPGEKVGWKSPFTYYGNLLDAFIGQYDSFTPIQLGQYVSAVANGGYRIRPHLVKEIRKGSIDPKKSGEVLTVIKPDVLNRISIDPKYLKVAQEGMAMVTEPGGTAYRYFAGLPFKVAAKTGTAQTGADADNSLIVGYAPRNNPKIAFVVVVPNGKEGYLSSGPIARKMLEAYHSLYPLTED